MANKRLFILLEGDDDERFFESVAEPLFKERYTMIKIYKYSQKPQKHKKTANFIKSIESMKADYIYVIDFNNAPCITAKKEEIMGELDYTVTGNKIIVVVKEIEGWYLAGLDEKTSKRLGIRKKIRTTDKITKEHFNQLIPKDMPRIEFMLKILENYEVGVAEGKNRSFGYFLNKWINDGKGV